MARKSSTPPSNDDLGLAIGVPTEGAGKIITARKAGAVTDLKLSISPRTQATSKALRNLAKALNLALKSDFIETDLDHIYKAARVRNGRVEIIHRDYIGLGDGLFASLGKSLKSFRLTLTGPDPASPEGQEWIRKHGNSSLTGVLDLIGRKLNLLQEFEDKLPFYTELTLDRLEGSNIITDWHRNEWKVSSTPIGLDVIIEPVLEDEDEEE